MTLTQWFGWNTEPVNKGVYQRLTSDNKLVYSYWNEKWYCFSGTRKAAIKHYIAQIESNCTWMPWRGIAL